MTDAATAPAAVPPQAVQAQDNQQKADFLQSRAIAGRPQLSPEDIKKLEEAQRNNKLSE